MTTDEIRSDQIVKAAVAHGVETANNQFPPLKLKIWQKALIFLAGGLLITNSVVNGVVVNKLSKTSRCNVQVTQQGRDIADDDRQASDLAFARLLAAQPLSPEARAQAKRDYLAARRANDKARAEAYSRECG